MPDTDLIQPQMDPNDFGLIVSLFKPRLQAFAKIENADFPPLEKAVAQKKIFAELIDALEATHQNDILMAFVSENWHNFISDLELDLVLEHLEINEKQKSSKKSHVPDSKVQAFLDKLVLLLGVKDKYNLPDSGVDLVRRLYERNKELEHHENLEKVKIKWLTLFKSSSGADVGIEDLVNMAENLGVILQENNAEFRAGAKQFFGDIDLSHLTSKEIIAEVSRRINLKPITTPTHLLVLRELLAWNAFFSRLQKGLSPNEQKLDSMIIGWPHLIENLLGMSMTSPEDYTKTSTHFFRTAKKIFGVNELPYSVPELIATLQQRIARIESDQLRRDYEHAISKVKVEQ